jgi:DNA polymerase-4
MDRIILHCDCNGFFASVECILHPEYRDVPMAVCGNPENRHGIILAKNERAKKYGIQTAETIWQAKKKCPELVLAPPHHEEYRRYSKRINAIYQRYTDLVEPFGIDESWLDVTGSQRLFGDGKQIADELRKVIREEIGLTISVGVSFNKIFAKLGSDYKKPDATTVISRENWKSIVFPLPVNSLLYVGKSANETLAKLGIHTIGQLAECDPSILTAHLGKAGGMLHDYANGLDNSPVRNINDRREIKSVGNGMTFKRDLVGINDIRVGVTTLADSVAGRMRKYGVKCWAVQVTIRNPSFKTITRQKTLSSPTHLAKELAGAAMELIQSAWNLNAPIRMLTITGLNLIPGDVPCEQLSFFQSGSTEREKQEHLETALDAIRLKYGSNSVAFGGIINNDIGIEEPDYENERK